MEMLKPFGKGTFWGFRGRWVIFLAGVMVSVSCGPPPASSYPFSGKPGLHLSHFETADGRILPVQSELPAEGSMKAVVLALHGFNDYKHAFSTVGPFLKARGIGLVAYDQQGFGLAPEWGSWAGGEVYAGDLRAIVNGLHHNYPRVPVYVLGESMGGAVAVAAFEDDPLTAISGIVLSAPAVWSRDTMPWYQQLVLSLATWMAPELKLTGSGLQRRASDNLPMLRELGRDPWVIKETRVAAISGLADLMDLAQVKLDRLRVPVLILYGGQDEIIPKEPVEKALKSVLGHHNVRLAYYPSGFHLLLRDLESNIPLGDLESWILNPEQRLPSGCEVAMREVSGWGLEAPAACRSGLVDRAKGRQP